MKNKLTIVALVFLAALGAVAYSPTPHSPTVLVQQQLLNQTTSLSPEVLFTANNDNEFRLTAITSTAACGAGGGLSVFYAWNDGIASNLAGVGGLTCPTGTGNPGNGQGIVTFHLAAGQSVSLSTLDNGSVTYNLYITLERL